jgi:regulatory protein
MIPVAIDQIISELITNNYLNETRFAQAYVRGKFRHKKWGKIRIQSQLKLRQISPWNIKKAMEEIPYEEYLKTFDELFNKFWVQYKQKDLFLCQKKVVDRLQYRGWENELIFEAINQKKREYS